MYGWEERFRNGLVRKMAERIAKGVYPEKSSSPDEKLRLKGELRTRAAELLRRSDDAQREAQRDIFKIRNMGLQY
jgi:hypothetical protein